MGIAEQLGKRLKYGKCQNTEFHVSRVLVDRFLAVWTQTDI